MKFVEEFYRWLEVMLPIIGFTAIYLTVKNNFIQGITNLDCIVVAGFIFAFLSYRKLASIANTLAVFSTWCIVNVELVRSLVQGHLDENK